MSTETAPEALPDLDVARPLILEGLGFCKRLAALTATTTDDEVVDAAIGIVNGPLFGMAYRLIARRLSGVPQSPDVAEDLDELQTASPTAIPIAAILAAIELAMKFWGMWRNRAAPAPTPTTV
jgi:hypothetical protein